jgi:hypothetical protein
MWYLEMNCLSQIDVATGYEWSQVHNRKQVGIGRSGLQQQDIGQLGHCLGDG